MWKGRYARARDPRKFLLDACPVQTVSSSCYMRDNTSLPGELENRGWTLKRRAQQCIAPPRPFPTMNGSEDVCPDDVSSLPAAPPCARRDKVCRADEMSGVAFLEAIRCRTVLFFGDRSVTEQWQSLVCYLHGKTKAECVRGDKSF